MLKKDHAPILKVTVPEVVRTEHSHIVISHSILYVPDSTTRSTSGPIIIHHVKRCAFHPVMLMTSIGLVHPTGLKSSAAANVFAPIAQNASTASANIATFKKEI